MQPLTIDHPCLLTLLGNHQRRIEVAVGQAADAAVAWQWLSTVERERADTLRRPARRAEYIAGHGLLNRLAAQRGGSVQVTPAGQPRIDGRRPLAASISHSGGWIVAAAGDAGGLGVDIEAATRGRDYGRLAARLGWPESLDRDGFLRRWSLWEAAGKSRGLGALRGRDELYDAIADAVLPQPAGSLIMVSGHLALTIPVADNAGWLSIVALQAQALRLQQAPALWRP